MEGHGAGVACRPNARQGDVSHPNVNAGVPIEMMGMKDGNRSEHRSGLYLVDSGFSNRLCGGDAFHSRGVSPWDRFLLDKSLQALSGAYRLLEGRRKFPRPLKRAIDFDSGVAYVIAYELRRNAHDNTNCNPGAH